MTTQDDVAADLLVIGAGPYAYAAAAYARERGIDTHVVGRPMAFWREQMPGDMFLRSSPDWHLDVGAVDTFEAFFEDRGMRRADYDPVPISVFLDYTEWFRERKDLRVDERLVAGLERREERFCATMQDGSTITAEKVFAVPGVRHFVHLPAWHASVPPARRAHTSDLVSFDDLADARVAVIGGRQSAYEWAALLCDHGAARVDVVHRHPTPQFAKVSWAFCNEYVDQTLAHRGWWRTLPAAEQQRVATQFWQVGRLTLEPWLTPRLRSRTVTSHPGCSVVSVSGEDEVVLGLSDGSSLVADLVVFASGYQADLGRVPYLADVLDAVSVTDGFPDLTEGFETSLPGLSVLGFASTRDFGPFYGFTKGCPSAARIAVEETLL
jgi:FAD-dependent urate hydroxylase